MTFGPAVGNVGMYVAREMLMATERSKPRLGRTPDVQAAMTRAVMVMSSRLGVGSPEGWLCTKMTALASSSNARFATSRG